MFKIDLFRKKEGKKKIFRCKDCNLEFEDKERLSRHSRKAHTQKSGGDMPNRNPFGY